MHRIPVCLNSSAGFRVRASRTRPGGSSCFRKSVNPSREASSFDVRRQRCVAARAAALSDIEAQEAVVDGDVAKVPATPGVYAVYDENNDLQYIGLSRKISMSIAYHARELPELTKKVKILEIPDGTRESLTAAWKEWLQEHVKEAGSVPPGNVQGEKKWQPRKVKRAPPELKLTPGKGVEDLTCPIEDLIDMVVKENEVLAIIKGTRMEPQCGFSYKLLSILNQQGADYRVLNVLDEVYNPGLREAIKVYSQWPTIPQLYVKGEFVGGSDIVDEMNENGELGKLLKA
ncbi:hypothetical protein BSKO_11357 [Bryopsis sp. KO-2023]|nr:hypothetical protein BSKO_11357 [Bryopsis sp. KO-2023]